eukprot:7452272-Karenia_brevis.AAC.1
MGSISTIESGLQWEDVWRGIVSRPPTDCYNGCAASMRLLAAKAACWVHAVQEAVPEVRLGVYVDDRSMFAGGSDCVNKLERANA